jgi:hypothetical protein
MQTAPSVIIPGSIPGFNDYYTPKPLIYNVTATVDYIISPTLVLEGTYGTIKNQLAGGGSPAGVLADAAANKNNTLSAFPDLYPNAGKLDSGYYAYGILQQQGSKAPEYSNGQLNMPPAWGFGSLVGDAPPSLIFPSYLNVNHTQDVAISLTKVWGQHTIKGGFYLNHSWKAQNTGAGGVSNLYWQGYVSFANDTNNPLDSGFGFSNAVLGVFDQYLQQSTYVEGSFLYNNVEGYIQDNWKVTRHLTLDYGIRLEHMTPQYDQFDQESNFFPNQFTAANSQVLYTAGCANGAAVCSGNTRDAKNPITGQVLTAGGANTQVLIGTPIPGIGNPLNGIMQAGHGIANTNYTWAPLVAAPRFGLAYNAGSGESSFVIRGGAGLYYDRPDGNTVFSTPGNVGVTAANGTPVTDQSLYYGQLQTVGSGGLSPLPVGQMVVTQYDAKIPSTVQWNLDFQKELPGQMVVDVAYVGYYAYNRFGATQGGTQQLENQVPLGTAFLPQYQDPTLGTSTIPGATAFTTNLLRPYPGLQSIAENATKFHDVYHSAQFSLTRRLRDNVSFVLNYTRGFELKGNTGLVQRYALQNGALVLRSDEAAYEALNSTLDPIPNFLKANITWYAPGITGRGGFVHQLTKDWQLSSVLTVQSGAAYTLGYSYQNNGSNVNITGSPDFAGTPVLGSGLGSGCGSRLDGFNALAVTGPTSGSVQMESGRNYMRYCPTAIPDLSVVRRFHFWKFQESKTFEFRADIFNAVNAEFVTGRSTSATFNNPTSMTLENPEYSGTVINAGRSTPANAGFGAATAANAQRTLQLEVRIGW